jgi:hypothetical protein
MKSIAWIGAVFLIVTGCGDSDGVGSGFSGGTLCEDVCSWPASCFDQFAPTLGDADCVEACEASVDFVGAACLEAINATVYCLGTCSEADITVADIERCEGTVLQIDSACE